MTKNSVLIVKLLGMFKYLATRSDIDSKIHCNSEVKRNLIISDC